MMGVRQLAASDQQRRFSQEAQTAVSANFHIATRVFGHEFISDPEIVIFSEPIAGSIPQLLRDQNFFAIDNYFQFPLRAAKHILDS